MTSVEGNMGDTNDDDTENIKNIDSSGTRDRCLECSQKVHYCKPCISTHFRDEFIHWTSGDSNIDKLIQSSQLNAYHKDELIEWMEYSNFEIVEFIAHGGFGSIYKAIWKDGPICNGYLQPPWNIKKSKWNRDNNKEVAIKKFRNTTSVSSELLNEVKNNLMLNPGYCNKIYGMTRDPQNGEYAIVMEFRNVGNVRELIKKNHNILNWELIINKILIDVSFGLYFVHYKNYLHRDFHSGNILNNILDGYIYTAISDFGLCCPADQKSTDKTLYGVLPFVAPEVLRGGEFTKAADIYGFGMLMLEIISGEPPFVNRDYDLQLALNICKGERPLIPEYTPKPYAALMKRCWDPIPTNRPETHELIRQINDWGYILRKYELNDRQLAMKVGIEEEFSRERENRWKKQLAELATKPFSLKKSQNMLTSKQLDYFKQLTQLLEVKKC
ncbi:hypothetical protein RclHR1_00700007 [Rhizophagus clarus]|uniref:Kinase-like domain-containing protein n=1 Tax=Rhizophagus clarus TaxID=94130 RepID=A0A2Z6RUD7_9GLOM|nr:hypothetical protein RclHR1_00700007 [Rhizophagus clarus]GES99814.1 kinase-like domain-containing protein [Rhizophagus clarus]